MLPRQFFSWQAHSAWHDIARGVCGLLSVVRIGRMPFRAMPVAVRFDSVAANRMAVAMGVAGQRGGLGRVMGAVGVVGVQ